MHGRLTQEGTICNRLPSLLLATSEEIEDERSEPVRQVSLGGSATIRILTLTSRGCNILRIGSLQSCIGTAAVKSLGFAVMKRDELH